MASISATTYGEGVYPPSDDTFLLVDALEQDLAAFSSGVGNESAEAAAKKSKLISSPLPLDGRDVASVVEVGSGSGFVSASASVLLPGAYVVGTDLSQRACLATRATLAAHTESCSGRSDVLGTESLLGLRPGAPFDVVLVNPPYVPTSSEELRESLSTLRERGGAAVPETEGAAFTLTWAGGLDGVEMTVAMLEAGLRALAAAGGRLYLIVVQENQPEELARRAQDVWRGVWADRGRRPPRLAWAVAVQTRASNELLSVLRFVSTELEEEEEAVTEF